MFLFWILLIFGTGAAKSVPVEFRDQKSTSTDVIIVGAGCAGIAAASRLIENGFDVIILEAENRIGGRVWSHPYGNGTVELGAQAVWGNDNFLINFVREHDLIAKPTNVVNFPIIDTGILVNETLEREIGAINSDFAKFLQSLLDASSLPDYQQRLSLGEYLDLKFGEFIESSKNPELASTVYDGFVRVLKTEDSADSLYDLSLQTYIRRKDKNTRVTLKVPFVDVLDLIGANIPQPRLFLNEKVVKISRKFFITNGHSVSVRTASGREFSAKHVIMTTSLGVLKTELESLFEPGLPMIKQEAIRTAGFGNLAKIAMIFEEEFWSQLKPHIANLPLFWTMDNDVDHERRYADRFWMRGLESFKSLGAPAPNYALVGFIPGCRAADMELLSDDAVISNLTGILKQFTGLEIPKPKALLRGNWFHNPNFRGSFSYISQDFSERGFTNADLAEPVWFEYNFKTRSIVPLLLFAGEATHDKFFSHASGALETGFREADRIIAIYKK